MRYILVMDLFKSIVYVTIKYYASASAVIGITICRNSLYTAYMLNVAQQASVITVDSETVQNFHMEVWNVK